MNQPITEIIKTIIQPDVVIGYGFSDNGFMPYADFCKKETCCLREGAMCFYFNGSRELYGPLVVDCTCPLEERLDTPYRLHIPGGNLIGLRNIG